MDAAPRQDNEEEVYWRLWLSRDQAIRCLTLVHIRERRLMKGEYYRKLMPIGALLTIIRRANRWSCEVCGVRLARVTCNDRLSLLTPNW